MINNHWTLHSDRPLTVVQSKPIDLVSISNQSKVDSREFGILNKSSHWVLNLNDDMANESSFSAQNFLRVSIVLNASLMIVSWWESGSSESLWWYPAVWPQESWPQVLWSQYFVHRKVYHRYFVHRIVDHRYLDHGKVDHRYFVHRKVDHRLFVHKKVDHIHADCKLFDHNNFDRR